MSTKKVGFILPAYHAETDTHFGYTLELLESVAKIVKSSLIIEDASSDIYKNSVFSKVITQTTNKKPFNLIERFLILLRECISGTQIFYVHYSYFSLFFLLLLKPFFNLKIYFWHAELFEKEDFSQMTFIEKYLLKTAINFSPNIITASQTLREGYSQVFGISKEKIKVVPNWVEKKPIKLQKNRLRQDLGISPKDKVFLFIHRLSPRKGAHHLPEIHTYIKKKIGKYKLLIAGDGPLKGSLIEELSDPNVVFLGSVAHQNISSYFNIADVFIMPSLREGSPRVILESMLYRVPIVTTNVGSIREMTAKEQKEAIVAVDDIETFSRTSIKIAQKNNKKMIDANYKKVKKDYSLSEATEALKKAFAI